MLWVFREVSCGLPMVILEPAHSGSPLFHFQEFCELLDLSSLKLVRVGVFTPLKTTNAINGFLSAHPPPPTPATPATPAQIRANF